MQPDQPNQHDQPDQHEQSVNINGLKNVFLLSILELNNTKMPCFYCVVLCLMSVWFVNALVVADAETGFETSGIPSTNLDQD